MKKICQVITQIGLLILITYVGNWFVTLLHLPISGSMLGIVLVFILLKMKVLPLSWVEEGANWLLKHLLLFFIPAAVGIIQYTDAMSRNGSQFLLIIVISTAAVMACTGLTADYIYRKRGHHDDHVDSHAAANDSHLPGSRPSARPPQ